MRMAPQAYACRRYTHLSSGEQFDSKGTGSSVHDVSISAREDSHDGTEEGSRDIPSPTHHFVHCKSGAHYTGISAPPARSSC